MKSKVIVLTLAAAFSFSGFVLAEDAAVNAPAAPAVAAEQARPELVIVGNTKCPVCGMEIPKEFLGKYTVESNGKIYNVCSPNDRDMFMADPAKYGKVAEAAADNPSAEPVQAGEVAPSGEAAPAAVPAAE
jgi:YHS domain-containing protein